MASKIARLLSTYRAWYAENYLATLIDVSDEEALADYEDSSWRDPLVGLRPLTGRRAEALARRWDPLPKRYLQLVTEVGVGTILSAYHDEPLEFRLLAPKEIIAAKKAMLSWLSAADREIAERELGLDVGAMLPFFADSDWGYFGVLTRRTKADDHVVLFDHAHEQGRPFGQTAPIYAFFESFIARAKKFDTINPFSGF